MEPTIINGDIADKTRVFQGNVIVNGDVSGKGGVTSKSGWVIVNGDKSGSGSITAKGDVTINGAVSGTGNITSTHGDVAIGEGNSGTGKISTPKGKLRLETDKESGQILDNDGTIVLQGSGNKVAIKDNHGEIVLGKRNVIDVQTPETAPEKPQKVTNRVTTPDGRKLVTDGTVHLVNNVLSIKGAHKTTITEKDGDVLTITDGDISDNIVKAGRVLFNGKVIKEATDTRALNLTDKGHGIAPSFVAAKPVVGH